MPIATGTAPLSRRHRMDRNLPACGQLTKLLHVIHKRLRKSRGFCRSLRATPVEAAPVWTTRAWVAAADAVLVWRP